MSSSSPCSIKVSSRRAACSSAVAVRLQLAAWFCVTTGLLVASPEYEARPFRLEGHVTRIVPADLDRDGFKDLVCARRDGLEILLQQAEAPGFRSGAFLALDGEAVGWDVARSSADAPWRVLAILDGTRVVAWSFDAEEGRFSEPVELLTGVRAFLPRGVRHLHFVRDVNGDGVQDLIIPGAGLLQLYFGDRDSYLKGPAVHSKVELETELTDAPYLTDRVGQSIRMPLLEMRDLNADGTPDLFSQSEDRLEAYLADASGVLPSAPTYDLDLAKIRERNRKPDEVDFSNLTAFFAEPVQVLLEDFGGDGIDDLLLREGGRTLLFRGTPTGIDLRRPHQVLKSAGNLLSAFLHDEDGDGDKDLWLLRAETIALSDVFVWFMTSGSVDFETYVYRSDGSRFSRRPVRKLSVQLRFPSLLSMRDLAKEVTARAKENRPADAGAASVAGDPETEDLLVVTEASVRCYFDREVTPDLPGLLNLLGYTAEKDSYVVHLEEIVDEVVLGASRQLAALGGRPPDLEVAFQEPSGREKLIVTHLNADGVHDMIIVSEWSRSAVRGTAVRSVAKRK